jgi:chromosome segregation ATPase
MMKRGLLPLLLCLLLGGPVWAASGLDALRAEARTARIQVRELRGRQQELRAELNTLAGRIEILKAERQGRLVPGTELEGALRRSQELSNTLTGLAQTLAGAESDSERRHLALYQALSEELARVRTAWDATQERSARADLLSRLRNLRAERDAVRSALPASQVPALGRPEANDDPEDLLEQADALRDTEDKVRQRLRTLHARITEVREERELDRRMRDFLGEESMFDEQDRRLRLRLDATTRTLSVETDQRSAPFSPEAVSGPPRSGSSPDSIGAPGDGSGSPPPQLAQPPSRASDYRPQVGEVRGQALASGDPEDLPSLEAEVKRLEALARELKNRASSLEHRARELE